MLHLVAQRGLQKQIEVDSAGTASYHLGEPADARSAAAARRRGIELPSRARQFSSGDLERFDYVMACDDRNLEHLWSLAEPHQRDKIHLLLDFDANQPKGSSVPDPYYGGARGFEDVLDLCHSACAQLLDTLVERHGLRAH